MTELQTALSKVQKAGIKDKFLASKLGVAPQTVYAWRSGKFEPQKFIADSAIALAERILSI